MTPLAIAIYSFKSEFETAADLTISFIFGSYFYFKPPVVAFYLIQNSLIF